MRASLRRLHPRHWLLPALILIASATLIVGLFLPLIQVEKMLFWESEYSVLTGIAGLWDDDQHVLAVVILFFSVLFPVAKLGLLWCVWTLRFSVEQRALLVVWLERLGKWSMLDVFAVAILVVAAKLGAAADVTPQPGVYVFGSAVVLSMIATSLTERLSKHRSHPPAA